MGPVTDIHMHVVPGVDDGALNMEESLTLLRLAAEQGVGTVFATPHSSAYDWDPERTRLRFSQLRLAAAEAGLQVRLFPGCEIAISPDTAGDCVRALLDGRYPTLGGTRYALIEFDPYGTAARDAAYCVDRLRGAGFFPVIAHAERYRMTTADVADDLRERGAKIQINAYSIVSERNDRIRACAHALLTRGLADFIGSDAHRPARRPPVIAGGVEMLARCYGEEAAHRICTSNPEALLIANE